MVSVKRQTPARKVYRDLRNVWAWCTDCGKCVKMTGLSRHGWHRCNGGFKQLVAYPTEAPSEPRRRPNDRLV